MNDNISGHDSRATPGGHLIVASRYAEDFAEGMFEPRYWENANAVTGTAGGRGMVLFVDSGHEQWVLRHYRRGGLMTPVMDDRYFWSGLQNTRAVREFRLLHDLHERGLPVPRPVAARVCRDGLFYRADLLTVRIADARSLA
ncbi:MAG: 3-deoxy-D-manno-octulosonic acid kinase, partial [Gammaproteobacteria bacterium]|nr:3-deoxy-D-manno-octulosonic acid kinase [Gammaproteobacteria bacterium]